MDIIGVAGYYLCPCLAVQLGLQHPLYKYADQLFVVQADFAVQSLHKQRCPRLEREAVLQRQLNKRFVRFVEKSGSVLEGCRYEADERVGCVQGDFELEELVQRFG